MIRFGPAGIPLSCKGRTLRDGIEDVHNLGLTAMEAQLVRAHVQERAAEPEEIGLKPKNLTSDMVIEIVRKKGDKEQVISDLDEPVKKGDTLVALTSGTRLTTWTWSEKESSPSRAWTPSAGAGLWPRSSGRRLW